MNQPPYRSRYNETAVARFKVCILNQALLKKALLFLVLALLTTFASMAAQTTPPPPLGTLTPSGPVVATADGQIIENLLITATGSTSIAVNLNGKANVTVRNCYIRHEHVGVFAQGSMNPKVDHCAFVRTPVPPRGTGDSEASGVHYVSCTGTAKIVSNCEFWNSSVAVLVHSTPGVHVFNINGYNMMGPMPRGQLFQADHSHNVILEDFYNYNDLNVSWTEDNVNLYFSDNAIIRRGCVDGNNSPSGVGVIFDANTSDLIQGGLVEDVDALHQGNGAFSSVGAVNTRFNRVRTRDGHNVGVGGRGAPTSNGLSFASFGGSSGTTLVGSYRNPANPNNLIWDTSTYASWTINDVDFTPRGPIVLTGMPYSTGSPGNLAQGKPATASAVENTSTPASNAVDGNPTTRWSSPFSDPQWIYVDLGSTYNISRVKLSWEFAYGKSYQIQVSPNASTWTTIYSTTTGDGGVDDLTGLSGSGRYVRMYATQRGTVYGYSLWEFEVYGTAGGLPSPWSSQDIGAVGATGSASSSSGTFTVAGSGADIWGTADEFRYVYQSASGDCEIKARVASMGNTSPNAKAGVMIRETLTAGSKHALLNVKPTGATDLVYNVRNATGGTTTGTSTGGSGPPYWVRVVRVGNTFTAYKSTNGTTWTTVGSSTITMGTSVYIGLAVSSANDGTLCTATFDNVTAIP